MLVETRQNGDLSILISGEKPVEVTAIEEFRKAIEGGQVVKVELSDPKESSKGVRLTLKSSQSA